MDRREEKHWMLVGALRKRGVYLRRDWSSEREVSEAWVGRAKCPAYTDMLGCSMSRSSRGLVSSSTGSRPLAVKQGGGVTNQLSSSATVPSCRKPSSSASSSEDQAEQQAGGLPTASSSWGGVPAGASPWGLELASAAGKTAVVRAAAFANLSQQSRAFKAKDETQVT